MLFFPFSPREKVPEGRMRTRSFSSRYASMASSDTMKFRWRCEQINETEAPLMPKITCRADACRCRDIFFCGEKKSRQRRGLGDHFVDVNAIRSAAIAVGTSGGVITPAMRPCGSSTASDAE